MLKKAFLAIFLLSSFSFAGGHACKKDIDQFCKEAKGDREKMAACFQQHKDQFSDECKAQHAKTIESLKDLKEACAQDVANHCPDVQPGDKKIRKCLHENKEKLTDTCKAAIKNARKAHKRKS